MPSTTGNSSIARSCSIGLAPSEYSTMKPLDAHRGDVQARGERQRAAPEMRRERS